MTIEKGAQVTWKKSNGDDGIGQVIHGIDSSFVLVAVSTPALEDRVVLYCPVQALSLFDPSVPRPASTPPPPRHEAPVQPPEDKPELKKAEPEKHGEHKKHKK